MEKFCYNFFFYIQKSSVTDHPFVSFFEVKNQNELIVIKDITQDFINAAKSFISNNMSEKWDVKVTKTYIFQDKCYILYHLFLLFILGYELNFNNVIAITFHIFNYFQDNF